MNSRIIDVRLPRGKATYLYNPFWGEFFLPVEWPKRKRERIIRSPALIAKLRQAAGV